ncbi:hypothetical protein [Sorangium atrum]|uniref:Secreted protein n=1 Tax=Sorangium atrum TaxID=2995308 RepID=A0ABT5C6X1_9BACT|nr:hypothetical protein [Sorangium aterium]MDC0681723.1 hypothetical protein [Sorangium aterium]
MRLEVVRGPGAEGCADEALLRAEVARGLGGDPFEDDASRVLTVSIAQEGPELTALMALRESEDAGDTAWAEGFSTRRGCAELISGVALAIVAQILNAPERAPSPSERSLPPSTPLPQARRTAPEPPLHEAMPAPTERWRLEAGLGATLGLGITPGAAAGMTMSVGVRRPDWSVAVEGRGLVSLAKEVEGMRLGTTAFTAATVTCLRGRHLFGCGLATLGAVRFVPEDPWNMRVRSTALFGIGARFGSAWRLSDRWSVHGYAEAIWIVEDALLRRQVDHAVTPAPLYWTSPPLGAAFGLGVTATY